MTEFCGNPEQDNDPMPFREGDLIERLIELAEMSLGEDAEAEIKPVVVYIPFAESDYCMTFAFSEFTASSDGSEIVDNKERAIDALQSSLGRPVRILGCSMMPDPETNIVETLLHVLIYPPAVS